mmetsp:Transcript_34236/g.98719  ORF Transcript_34236/g.98719 Transcript_34236/m.98719 type:complete len:317 (-) Transcript_34236:646-1596(-)
MSNDEIHSARVAFPRVLYDMLEAMAEDPKKEEIVSWMPHGRAFKVHNPGKFEQEIMPSYFVERYDSFRFLLERWAFQGLRKGKDRGAYYNLKFVRGQREQIVDVSKDEMFAAMPEYLSPRDEPDFYSMPPAVSSRSRSRPKRETTEAVSSKQQSNSNGNKSSKARATTSKPSSKSSRTSRSRTEVQEESDDLLEAETSLRPKEGKKDASHSKKRSRGQTVNRQNSKRARSSRADTKASSSPLEEDSGSEEEQSAHSSDYSSGSPVLLAPTIAVFSGFKLPYQRVHVEILKSTDDFTGRGIEPFIHKRPVNALGRSE